MSTTVSRESATRFELSELATKHVFRRLIPFLLLMYIIAFLDRSNLSFAKDEFAVNNGISASAYALGRVCSSPATRSSRSPATSCCTRSEPAGGLPGSW